MNEALKLVAAARKFPRNTCASSRHAEQIGEALVRGEPYPMLEDERKHCGESILFAIASLYEARTERAALRAALDAAAAIIRRDRVELYRAHKRPDGKRGLAEYDAVLRQADAALGYETERLAKDAEAQ